MLKHVCMGNLPPCSGRFLPMASLVASAVHTVDLYSGLFDYAAQPY